MENYINKLTINYINDISNYFQKIKLVAKINDEILININSIVYFVPPVGDDNINNTYKINYSFDSIQLYNYVLENNLLNNLTNNFTDIFYKTSDNINDSEYINVLNNLLLNLNNNIMNLIVNISIKEYSDESLIEELPNEVILYEMTKGLNVKQLIDLMKKNKLWYNTIPLIITTINNEDQKYINNNLLIKFKNLTSLNLYNNNKITDEPVKQLINLTSLNLSNNRIITDESVKELTNLTSLNLSNNYNITDESVKNLTNLTNLNLTNLNLTNNDNITDELINYISDRVNIKR